jgi:hypothetical protein
MDGLHQSLFSGGVKHVIEPTSMSWQVNRGIDPTEAHNAALRKQHPECVPLISMLQKRRGLHRQRAQG